MGNSSSFPRPSSCPPSPITQSHPHLLPTTIITTGTQQKTIMQLTSYASPAILGFAATFLKMAPLSTPILQGSGRLFVRLLARAKCPPLAVQMALEALGQKGWEWGRGEEEVAIPAQPFFLSPRFLLTMVCPLFRKQHSFNDVNRKSVARADGGEKTEE